MHVSLQASITAVALAKLCYETLLEDGAAACAAAEVCLLHPYVQPLLH